MRGFVVDAQHRIEKGASHIYLFGRADDGRAFITKNRFEPYFSIKAENRTRAEELLKDRSVRFDGTDDLDPNDEPLVRVVMKLPSDAQDVRRLLEDENITCYEADVRPVRRFLIDHRIRGDVAIEGTEEIEDGIVRFDEPQIEGAEKTTTTLKVLSFDLETSGDANKLYSIALTTNDGEERAYLISDADVKGATSYPDEKSLLEAFCQDIREIDPDIITGWNVVDFDFARLRDYAQRAGIPLNLGRLDWDVSMRIYDDFLRTSTVDIPGRQVLDGIETLKTSFVDLEDYTLQTASSEILGETKEIVEKDRRGAIKDAYENRPAELITYNKKDTRLVLDILEKLDLITLTVERSRITGLLIGEVRGAVASLDSMYLRELRAEHHAYYSVTRSERGERIRGGFVMDSKPGLYENVLVFDFKSLYPSIISTFNIDPMTHRDDGDIEAPNGAKFRNEPEGIMPRLIRELSSMRDQAKKDRNSISSFALKITMNSMFGVLANPNCRFYSIELANAITHFGQHIIKHTAEELEKRGYEVIYGDTDSVFVNVRTPDEKEAERIGKELEEGLNEHFDTWIQEHWNIPSRLTIQFERQFAKFWMPSVRGSEAGSKKRYAGLVRGKDGDEIKITGLEYVRRDWTEAAREFQYALLDLLFHEGDPQSFVKGYIQDLRAGKMDEKLIYRKAIRKSLDEYVKTTPPHVKAARKLDKLESSIIDYYMTLNGPEPKQKLESPIDYEHYIDKQIKPLGQAILTTIGLDFDDILGGAQQKSLFDWD